MLAQHIQQQLYDAADALVRSAEPLARPLAAAAEALAGCVTAGGRIWVCGAGAAGALAPLAASQLCGPFERERPPLPALLLPVLPPTSAPSSPPGGRRGTPTAADGSEGWLTVARQIRAAASPADLLVVLADGPAGLPALLRAAREKELAAVVLSPSVDEDLLAALDDTDVLISPPPEADGSAPKPARALELQLLAWHGLCDAVDQLLLGENPP